MKLIPEDVTSGLAKAIEIAFKPALIGSLVTYTISARLLEVPFTMWELLEILRVIAFNSICVSILVTLIVTVLVLMAHFMLRKRGATSTNGGEGTTRLGTQRLGAARMT